MYVTKLFIYFLVFHFIIYNSESTINLVSTLKKFSNKPRGKSPISHIHFFFFTVQQINTYATMFLLFEPNSLSDKPVCIESSLSIYPP